MKYSAQVILTGYNKKDINKSFRVIKEYSKQNNLSIDENKKLVKPKSKLCNCNIEQPKQNHSIITGTKTALQKIHNLKLIDGIYLETLIIKH